MVSDLLGLSRSQETVVSAVNECSRNLTGVEETTRELLQDVPILHVDETGMRVKGIRHWLHVASTDLLTYHQCHRNRGAKATDAMGVLPEYLLRVLKCSLGNVPFSGICFVARNRVPGRRESSITFSLFDK